MIFVWISLCMCPITWAGIKYGRKLGAGGRLLVVAWSILAAVFAILGEIELFFPGAIL